MITRVISLLTVCLITWSCSPECDIPLPSQPETPTPQSFADSLDVQVETTWPTQRAPWLTFSVGFRKNGVVLSRDSGDRLILNGAEMLADSLGNYRLTRFDLVEDSSYMFTYYRGNDSASFELPVPTFDITSPNPGSHVFFIPDSNTTIRYSPAGGSMVWAFYANTDQNESNLVQNHYDDNGTYSMMKDMIDPGRGYFHLVREYRDSILHPVFGSLKYQYFTRSHSVNVTWH